MIEPKTKLTSQSPLDFLATIEPEQKRIDSFGLLELFEEVTGEKARMWGSSIVGFGQYQVVSKSNGQMSEWPLVAFSPRKQSLTLYVMEGNEDNPELEKLGEHTRSKSCLYIKKLSDVDQTVLRSVIEHSLSYSKKVYLD